jgi:hypothetical protein
MSPLTPAMTEPAIAGPKAPKTIGAGFMNSEFTSAALIAGDVLVSVPVGWFANCIVTHAFSTGENSYAPLMKPF